MNTKNTLSILIGLVTVAAAADAHALEVPDAESYSSYRARTRTNHCQLELIASAIAESPDDWVRNDVLGSTENLSTREVFAVRNGELRYLSPAGALVAFDRDCNVVAGDIDDLDFAAPPDQTQQPMLVCGSGSSNNSGGGGGQGDNEGGLAAECGFGATSFTSFTPTDGGFGGGLFGFSDGPPEDPSTWWGVIEEEDPMTVPGVEGGMGPLSITMVVPGACGAGQSALGGIDLGDGQSDLFTHVDPDNLMPSSLPGVDMMMLGEQGYMDGDPNLFRRIGSMVYDEVVGVAHGIAVDALIEVGAISGTEAAAVSAGTAVAAALVVGAMYADAIATELGDEGGQRYRGMFAGTSCLNDDDECLSTEELSERSDAFKKGYRATMSRRCNDNPDGAGCEAVRDSGMPIDDFDYTGDAEPGLLYAWDFEAIQIVLGGGGAVDPMDPHFEGTIAGDFFQYGWMPVINDPNKGFTDPLPEDVEKSSVVEMGCFNPASWSHGAGAVACPEGQEPDPLTGVCVDAGCQIAVYCRGSKCVGAQDCGEPADNGGVPSGPGGGGCEACGD